MRKVLLIALLIFIGNISGFAFTNESSPVAKMEVEIQQKNVDTNKPTSLPIEAEEKKAVSPRMQKRLDKVKKIWEKKEEKIKQKLAKKGITDMDDVTFEDVVVLAGAIVVVLGIISIIFSPISAIVSVILGLAVYLIGKGYGGSLDAFF